MHRLISDYPNDIECLLNFWIKSLLYEASNVRVDVTTAFTQMNTQLLDSKPQKPCRCTRRGCGYRLSFFIVLRDLCR